MMPSAFDEENCLMDSPKDMPECQILSAYRGTIQGFPVVISCWKPTKEELEEIINTGRVWLIVWGETMPPVALSGINPFGESEKSDGQ